jgi:Lrp/AsnC family leucine-responsive transcriptional regulator
MKNKRVNSFETKQTVAVDPPKPQLDSVDRAILEIVQHRAREPFARIGQEVGLSPPSVAGRMQRLEDAGVIVGYRADVAPASVGFSLTAFLLARSLGPDAQVAEAVQSRPEIIECYRVTGEVSFVIRAVLPGVEHLEELIDYLEETSYVTTLIVLSVPLKRTGLPIGQATERKPRPPSNRRKS